VGEAEFDGVHRAEENAVVAGLEGLLEFGYLPGYEEFAQVPALFVFVFGAERTAAEEPDGAAGESGSIAADKVSCGLHPVEVVDGAANHSGVEAGRIGGLLSGLHRDLKALLAQRCGNAVGNALSGAVAVGESNENVHVFGLQESTWMVSFGALRAGTRQLWMREGRVIRLRISRRGLRHRSWPLLSCLEVLS